MTYDRSVLIVKSSGTLLNIKEHIKVSLQKLINFELHIRHVFIENFSA